MDSTKCINLLTKNQPGKSKGKNNFRPPPLLWIVLGLNCRREGGGVHEMRIERLRDPLSRYSLNSALTLISLKNPDITGKNRVVTEKKAKEEKNPGCVDL